LEATDVALPTLVRLKLHMATATQSNVLDLREAGWTSRSSLGAEGTDYFLVLCCRENREVYEAQFKQFGAPFVFASSVEELLRYGFMLPPLAIVIDVYTATRIGTEKVTGLFNLGVAWPVMRANLDPHDVRVICLEPAKSQNLSTAVEELLQGDEGWRHPRFFRKSMRIDMRVRARLRENPHDPWRNANLLSISVGGAYLVLGGAVPAKGATAEIEVLDLGTKAISAKGHIAWRRTWNDGPDLPGVGIEFDPKTVTTELRTLVAQTIAPSVRTGNRQSLRESGPTADSIFASIETREAAREFNW
jgi:PilZ domain